MNSPGGRPGGDKDFPGGDEVSPRGDKVGDKDSPGGDKGRQGGDKGRQGLPETGGGVNSPGARTADSSGGGSAISPGGSPRGRPGLFAPRSPPRVGRSLMALRTDRTTRIPSSVASQITSNHAAEGCLFVRLRNVGNFENAHDRGSGADSSGGRTAISPGGSPRGRRGPF